MNNKTQITKLEKYNKAWHHIDASDKVLGKVATEAAIHLMGKHLAAYAPHQDLGDKVVITNASKVYISGSKRENKVYYKHTGYPKGLRSQTMEEIIAKDPTEVLRKAIRGMLPKNKLRDLRMKSLYIYSEIEHPHRANLVGSAKK